MSQATCCWCGSPLIKSGAHWWCGHQTSDACRLRQTRHAQYRRDARGRPNELLYLPLPMQAVWHEAIYQPTVTRFLLGGRAGPGKSTCLRRILYEFATLVPGFHALLLRKTHKDLDKSHIRFLQFEVGQFGGEWKQGDRIAVWKHRGQMDAVIRAGHFEDAGAIDDYLSAEFDCIAPDEIVTLEEAPMLELFTRARSTNPILFQLRGYVPDELDGSFVLAGTNPGGRLWVKDHWVTKAPDPEQYPHYNPVRWAAFLDAKLKDNPYLRAGYVEALRGMREARRRQLEDGDWDVFEGMMFSEWQPQRLGQPHHVGRFEELYSA